MFTYLSVPVEAQKTSACELRRFDHYESAMLTKSDKLHCYIIWHLVRQHAYILKASRDGGSHTLVVGCLAVGQVQRRCPWKIKINNAQPKHANIDGFYSTIPTSTSGSSTLPGHRYQCHCIESKAVYTHTVHSSMSVRSSGDTRFLRTLCACVHSYSICIIILIQHSAQHH